MRLALFLLTLPVLAQDNFTGAPIERSISPGESHAYRYPVQAGLFLYVTALQLEGDVALTLISPTGIKAGSRDFLRSPGSEIATWIAPDSGDCRIEVSNKTKVPARYRLEAVARTPSESDRQRHIAYTASGEALAALQKGGKVSLDEALAKFQKSIDGWHAADERIAEATSQNLAGATNIFLRDHGKAVPHFERAVALLLNEPDGISLLAATLNNLGQSRLFVGDLPKAREALEAAIAISVRTGNKSNEASARNNVSSVYRRLGEMELAIESLRKSAAAHKDLGNRSQELISLQNIAAVYQAMRNHQAALQQLSTNLRMAIELADSGREYGALRGLGHSYAALGELSLAQQFFERAEVIARKTGLPAGVSEVLSDLASVKFKLRDFAAARVYLDESIVLTRKSANALSLATSLTGLCHVLVEAGEAEKARPVAVEAVALNRKVSPKDGLASALVCAARIERMQGQMAAARTMIDEAMAKSSTQAGKIGAMDELAELELGLGNLLASLALTEEAVALAEIERAGIQDSGLRASSSSLRAGTGQRHTALLMRLHRQDPEAGYAERAFRATERARARTLAEMIADSDSGPRPALPPEQKLAAAITAVQRQLFRENVPVDRQKALRSELAAAEANLEAYRLQFTGSPSQAIAEPYDAARIQSSLLDESTALIEFALGTKESYAWVVSRSGFQSFVLPGREVIEKRAEAFRELLKRPVNALTAQGSMAAIDVEARRLYALLVGPLEASLKGKTRLLIVPDGGLHYVPFEALGLIDRFRISYAPSASALAVLRKRTSQRAAPTRSLLAMADPLLPAAASVPNPERGFVFTQLPNARTEVNALRALFGAPASRVFLGAEAREQNLKTEDISAYRFVHFATHGYFDEAQPARSGLVLAQQAGDTDDGMLQAREIFRLRLNADVVTLSACQSGLGQLLAGEGVMGLSRAFFYAGAQSLVVSLWNVNDAATAELMKTFYTHLKAGVARDEAMRRAKLALAKGPNRAWRHPYFWAPFVFLGDPLPAR